MAQVNPAANETLVESSPVGTTNNGYETGDPTAVSYTHLDVYKRQYQ